jgi:predicted RNA-binding protein YlxR (DUF448 family)
MNNYKDGDIFRWHYTDRHLETEDAKLGMRSGTLYWCCSRICYYHADINRFIDTYWSYGSDNKSFTPEEVEKKYELVFVANKNDLEEFKGDRNLYDSADIIDLNHANSSRGNIYIKKGAEKCREQIKKYISKRIAEEQYNVESAQKRVEDLIKKGIELDNTEDLDKFWV